MLDETTVELLRHLEHPNGWWRDTAQKLIILRKDRETVVPLLEGMARFAENRIDTSSCSVDVWKEWMGYRNGVCGRALCRSRSEGETCCRANCGTIFAGSENRGISLEISPMTGIPTVVSQLILSLGLVTEKSDPAVDLVQAAARNHLADKSVMLATGLALWGMKRTAAARRKSKVEKPLPNSPAIQKPLHRSPGNLPWQTGIEVWNSPDDMPKDHQKLISDW